MSRERDEIDWHDLLRSDPMRKEGRLAIRDLRLAVSDVFEYLAGGMCVEAIIEEFPGLDLDDLAACFSWAASVSRSLDAARTTHSDVEGDGR